MKKFGAGLWKHILKYISERLTAECGKGFSVQGLRNMRQFYLAGQPCFSKNAPR
ncbi:MAG: hypothetical protein II922_06305 [Succinimonas sp.]|nr:hypothetical protein [Succinimonas sp.]